MALNFPNNPEVNDIYTLGNSRWQWDGAAWNITFDQGDALASQDLTNVPVNAFRAKSVASGLSTIVYNVTIAGPQAPDTGHKYVLNGIYRPILNFVVGYTYVFDQSDDTNVYWPNTNGTTANPHPINFSADNLSGEVGGGTSYNTDVSYFLDNELVTQTVYYGASFNTAITRQVHITVTNDTPSTLYYWCWNHAAMGNEIAVIDLGTQSISGDLAYSWGDHASAGYLTSFTESDPTVPSHVKSITTTNVSNWNTAYGWGNHASAGYQAAASAITTSNIGSQSVNYAASAGSVAWNNVTSKPSTFTPSSHTHGITSITDSTRWWNNFGENHGTRSNFNTSYGFGWRYIQGSTNGPGVNGATQYYSVYVGLGNDYPATGTSSYGMQVAYPRDVSTPYIAIRYRENNSWGGWNKISAGYADSAGNSSTTSQRTFSGNLIGSSSVRAPIFYDQNHTGYYVDPANTSNLYALTVAATITGSISGTAGNSNALGGLAVHTARNNQANRVVRTDGSGYIQAGWINTTSGDRGTTAPTRIYASNDAYIRYYTPANFRQVLSLPTRTGGSASGTWGISITGNAASVTNGLYTTGAQTFTGTKTMGTQIALVANNFGRGVFGLYSATRYQHVWSMGAAYKTNDAGTSFGNMYGLTYTHTNIGTGANQAIAGLSHQLQHRTNGTLTAAIGSGIWTSGNVTAYSDISVKTNLEKIPNALNKIMQINGYTYDRTDYKVDPVTGEIPETKQAGVVAQEVEKVLPEVVSGSEGNKSVAYGNMVSLLIEGIKEQQSTITSLEDRINKLENLLEKFI